MSKLILAINAGSSSLKFQLIRMPEEKTVTYKINPNFKWSNGDPVTTKDIVKTYEIFANQDYIVSSKSLRFSKNRKAIVGIEEYNEGKADKISGLEVIDDSTMKIHLTEITPSVYWGGNFVSEFVNAKQFEGVPMDKIIESGVLETKKGKVTTKANAEIETIEKSPFDVTQA